MSGYSQGHAVVIAIANYKGVTSLPEAVLNDARDVTSTLTSPSYCGYDPGNVTMLLDTEATLENIRQALASVATRAKVEDSVVIFFSGHGARLGDRGGQESALVPVDCQLNRANSTTLTEAEFSASLTRIVAKRVVVLIDACHSGGAGNLKDIADGSGILGFDEKSLQRLAQGTGKVLIASSRAAESSLVFSGARNSLFTQYLLEALRGAASTKGDGFIRIFEIFSYVSEKVRSAAPGKQHPIFKASDLEDNFPVALDRGGEEKSPSASTSDNESGLRKLDEILADLYPVGPEDEEVWKRAGGDLSRLRLIGTGRAKWFSALRLLRQGGGGENIDQKSVVRVALTDFPHHPELSRILSSLS